MRSLPSTVIEYNAARKPVLTHRLFWLTGRNRETGVSESIGLWTGDDHRVITVGGVDRTYYGAGAILEMDALTHRAALEVRQLSITVSPLAPEVVQALKIYNPRLGRAEIHDYHCDAQSSLAIAVPIEVFRGYILSAPVTTPAVGGDAYCTITLASNAWTLTRSLTLKRSDAALRARSPSDGARKYVSLTGAIEVAWGEKSSKGPSGAGGSSLVKNVPELKFKYNPSKR